MLHRLYSYAFVVRKMTALLKPRYAFAVSTLYFSFINELSKDGACFSEVPHHFLMADNISSPSIFFHFYFFFLRSHIHHNPFDTIVFFVPIMSNFIKDPHEVIMEDIKPDR